MKCHFYISTLVLFLLSFSNEARGEAMLLDDSNFDTVIGNTELVMLNFYADWCRFSQMLKPVWDDLATKVAEKFPVEKVAIARVDCEKHKELASRFQITKYPTLKMMRNGQVTRKEYRGQRTADAMATFIIEQMTNPLVNITDLNQIKEAKESSKRHVLAYLESDTGPHHDNVQKLSSGLKDDCTFLAGAGAIVSALHPPGASVVTFSGPDGDEETYLGDVGDYAELEIWVTQRCVPLVRRITFQNAEELTEEGLPFLILFHDSDDEESPKKFQALVESELKSEKSKVNFLMADGGQFAHPLHHLGKSQADLPLLAIDSFRHMYLHPDYRRAQMPGQMLSFLADLHSGKLHREFHYGPEDPVKQIDVATSPPESTFKKLGPSPGRYTLLNKEEL